MKTRWTKLLVVLLTLAMVLSLAACGGTPEETPAQSTPEKTPAASTPVQTPEQTPAQSPDETPVVTPEETPVVTPEETPPATPGVTDDEPGKDTETGKQSTPEETPAQSPEETPAETPTDGVTRPTEPTWESYTKDEGEDNWVYEIEKNDVAIVIDGIIEENAYFAEGKAIYLISEINTTADGSGFDVFITADDTHIYVFYEFTKMSDPKIFWDPDYETKYHLDCVDFCLNLIGSKAAGTEFRIYAGVEGGMDAEGYFNGGAKNAGVDALYVKHTDKGYNVEFSIPLENVIGKDDNGDKMISFTALSTITTGYDDKGVPVRKYTVSNKAAGAEAKGSPSYLVVKDTAPAPGTGPDFTEDGRYTYTLNAGKEALAVDGVMDDAYANGLSWAAKYDLPVDSAHAGKYTDASKNTFDFYMAADADYVYGLYVIQDERIIGFADASAWYRVDCADFIYSLAGDPTKFIETRISGEAEGGLDSIKIDNKAEAVLPEGMVDVFVKKTDVGYNVEFKLDRAKFADPNMFCFLAVMGSCPITKTEEGGDKAVSSYPAIDNTSGKGGGNESKAKQNQIVIVDAPITATTPSGTAESGSNIYELTKSEAALTVDGVKDAAYKNGIALVATGNIPESGSYFNLYIAMDDTNVYFFYEFIKNEPIYYSATYKSPWHEDCANPYIDIAANPGYVTNNEFHILGGIEGGAGTAVVNNAAVMEKIGVTDYYVNHTVKGYNVEFSFPIANVTGTDANGDKMFTFSGVATITTIWLDPEGGTPLRSYAYVMNGINADTVDNEKKAPSYLVLKDTAATEPEPEDPPFENPTELVLGENKVLVKLDTTGAHPFFETVALPFVAPEAGEYVITFADVDTAVLGDANSIFGAALAVPHYFELAAGQTFKFGISTSAEKTGDTFVTVIIEKVEAEPEPEDPPFENPTELVLGENKVLVKLDTTGANPRFETVTLPFVAPDSGEYVITFADVDTAILGDNNSIFGAQLTVPHYFELAAGQTFKFGISTKAEKTGDTFVTVIIEKVEPEDPEVQRPTTSTPATSTTANGNWVYEIDKTETEIKVDGITEDAYYTQGLYLPAKYRLPESGSTFDIFFTADDTHIYVMYEFTKMEEIFYNEAYGSKHHFDCVDFVLQLGGMEVAGVEFRIWGTKEGDINTALYETNLKNVFIDAVYVKHTDAGYNVEFAIPLNKVSGIDANGDKKISFTAVATITTAFDGTTATKVYPVAEKAAGEEAKGKPSILVVKGTAVENGPDLTDDGRYTYTLNAGTAALAVDGVKDDAYANGLVWEAMYCDGPIANLNDANTYVAYIAADAEFIYVLYEIKDDNIVVDETHASYWWFDNAGLTYNLGSAAGTTGNTEFRIFANKEGGADSAYQRGVNATHIPAFFVKHVEGGYNVEFKIDRSVLNDPNVFSCIPMITLASSATSRTYVAPANASGASGNTSKGMLNEIKIVDAPEKPVETRPVAPENATEPTTDTDAGWVFEIEKATTEIVVDGVLDAEAYANGIYLPAAAYLPTTKKADSNSTFDLYITADDEYVYFFYSFLKEEGIFFDENYASSNWHHFDCVDFAIGYGGDAVTATSFIILGGVEGGAGVAMVKPGFLPESHGVTNYYVNHVEGGYNVEFAIPLDRVVGADANGDKMLSFTACSTMTVSYENGSPVRAYTTAASKLNNDPTKQAVDRTASNVIIIKGTKSADDPDRTEDGRYSYTLNAGKDALAVDGEKDEAYANGLVWEAKYALPKDSSVAKWFTNPEANTFTFYMAADANFVYCLYVVKDENIVGKADASANYRADCADFVVDVTADGVVNGAEVRIFGNVEGDITAVDKDATIACMTEIYVKKTADGYNVEFKLDRAQFGDADVFSFLAVGGACATDKTVNNGGSTTCYPAIENTSGQGGGNAAKAKLNEVKIVDAQ